MKDGNEGDATRAYRVTPQMIEAGLAVLSDSGIYEYGHLRQSDALLVEEIFRAMLAEGPPA